MERSVEEIIESFKEDDEFVTLEACGLLEMKGEESVETMIDALENNNDKHVKIGVARVLGTIKDERAIDPLIKTLKHPNKLVRREASTALSNFGEVVIDPLTEILNDDDWKVRGAAVWALGKTGNETTIPKIEKLLNDESGFVQTGAKWAIRNIEETNK